MRRLLVIWLLLMGIFLTFPVWAHIPRDLTWKVCGPDLNGRYCGMNGTGGFDAAVGGLNQFQPVITDFRGNVLGGVTNGAVAWNPARPTGYGAVHDYRPLLLGHGGNLVQSSAWRGRWMDISGLVWLGARNYDPVAGRFMESDQVWSARDPNYYSFCGGDPINGFDPDGRCVSQELKFGQSVLNMLNPVQQGTHLLRQAWNDFWGNGGGIEGLNVAYNRNNPFTPGANLIYKEDILTGREFTWWGDYSENAGRFGLNMLAMTGVGQMAREADAFANEAVVMVNGVRTTLAGPTENWANYLAAEARIGTTPTTMAEIEDAIRLNTGMADNAAAETPRTFARFGTAAHNEFETLNNQLDAQLQASGSQFGIAAEQFRDAAGNIVGRRAAGSLGLDAVVNQNGFAVAGFDLKTGAGWEANTVSQVQIRFNNIPVTQIRTGP